MTRLSTTLLCVLLASACVVTGPAAPPEPPSPTASPTPTPNPGPSPEPIATGRCAADAAPIYLETASSMDGVAHQRLAILASGAWVYETAGAGGSLRDATRGCLTGDMHARFVHALRMADFAPPPPPDVRCMAVSDTLIEYRDVAGERIARTAQPCGLPVSNDVVDLSAAAHMLTIEPQRAMAIPLPPLEP